MCISIQCSLECIVCIIDSTAYRSPDSISQINISCYLIVLIQIPSIIYIIGKSCQLAVVADKIRSSLCTPTTTIAWSTNMILHAIDFSRYHKVHLWYCFWSLLYYDTTILLFCFCWQGCTISRTWLTNSTHIPLVSIATSSIYCIDMRICKMSTLMGTRQSSYKHKTGCLTIAPRWGIRHLFF